MHDVHAQCIKRDSFAANRLSNIYGLLVHFYFIRSRVSALTQRHITSIEATDKRFCIQFHRLNKINNQLQIAPISLDSSLISINTSWNLYSKCCSQLIPKTAATTIIITATTVVAVVLVVAAVCCVAFVVVVTATADVGAAATTFLGQPDTFSSSATRLCGGQRQRQGGGGWPVPMRSHHIVF